MRNCIPENRELGARKSCFGGCLLLTMKGLFWIYSVYKLRCPSKIYKKSSKHLFLLGILCSNPPGGEFPPSARAARGQFQECPVFFLSVGCPTTTAKKQNLDENWWIENGKLPRTIRYRQKNVFHHHRSGLWAIIEATTLCTSKGPEKRVSMMQRFWESSGWLSTYG